MKQLSVVTGVIRYEFLMQLRRKSVWIAFVLMAALLAFLLNQFLALVGKPAGSGGPLFSERDIVIFWTQSTATLLPLGAGLLLADRMPRDRRTNVYELLRTTPSAIYARLGGKYVGAILATLIPALLVQLIGLGVLVAHFHDASVIPLSLLTFVVLVVPPVLFVGAYSIACTTLLWTPLYMFLFIGYWLWTNLNPSQQIPTLGGTYLSPGENYVYSSFFNFLGYRDGFYHPAAVWQGILNIAVLLALALIALVAAWRIQVAQANRN